ncbi:MAG: magnesium transporter [Phycisphaerae bacterium]
MSTPADTGLDAQSLRDSWSALTDEERVEAFQILATDEAQDFFVSIAPADQAMIIRGLSPGKGAVWMRFLPPDDAADLIQSIAVEERPRFEALLDAATLEEIRALLAYAEDEAGGLMNPRFARVRPDVTVDVAIRYLRRQTQNKLATFYYAYVLDARQRLCGVVSFRELFAARGDARIDEIMQTKLVSVREDADQETVARVIAAENLLAVPVLDAEDRMVGLITLDDIVDVVQEEATEDIQKLGGVQALEAPYMHVGFVQMLRKRAGWLSALFLGEMLTATAMGRFQNEIERAVVLAIFVPLIISSGGNSGSQAATLIVRALALNEMSLRDWIRVLGRELLSGVALGSWLGLIGFVRVILWQHLGLFDYGSHYLLVATTVWASLIGVVCFGTITGSMLPFLLRRLGFDPATSSAPFVATLVDVTGLVIYFGVAAMVLHGTLL